jgi:hypothetical protein
MKNIIISYPGAVAEKEIKTVISRRSFMYNIGGYGKYNYTSKI